MTNQHGFVLPSPLMIVGGVALAFGISTILFWRLYQGALDDYHVFKAQVEAQQEAIRLENEAKLAAMAAVQARTEQGWRTALDELRNRKHIRVQSDCGAREMPRLSTAAPGLNASAIEFRPSTEISVAECEARVNNAVEDATQVVHLNHWIQQQHEASK